MKPRVLVSALACHPQRGSEAFFGWSAVCALREKYDLDVLIEENSREALRQENEKSPLGFRAHFVGRKRTFHSNRLIARVQSWIQTFESPDLILAKGAELHRNRPFELSHHITISTWRTPCHLWRLKIPLIWGPIGGGESFPWECRSALSPSAQIFEATRESSTWISKRSRAIMATARKADWILAANQETQKLLAGLRGEAEGLEIQSPAIFSSRRIAELKKGADAKSETGPLRIFAGGNLEGRKGVAIALKALKIVKMEGIPFIYQLGGDGPERRYLERLAWELGLGRQVIFQDSLHGEKYFEELGQTHIFLLPSLREQTGLTLLEAMLAGCLPVVADTGGPGTFLAPDRGFKIPLGEPEAMAASFAEVIRAAHWQRHLIRQLGKKAACFVAQNFTEESYAKKIGSLYARVLKNRKLA